MHSHYLLFFFFFFNDTATTEIYTLSLHDALPICHENKVITGYPSFLGGGARSRHCSHCKNRDRKSTRLNSSHLVISYAVFCLKKKKNPNTPYTDPLPLPPTRPSPTGATDVCRTHS